MERKNTGQLSLACTGNLRDNRQPRRLGSVLPSSNAITYGKHLGLELNYLQEEIREVGREWKIMVPGSLQIRVHNLRNGPDKNDSDNGKEDVGIQKRC